MNVINELRREGTFDHTIAGIDVEGNEMEGVVELFLLIGVAAGRWVCVVLHQMAFHLPHWAEILHQQS